MTRHKRKDKKKKNKRKDAITESPVDVMHAFMPFPEPTEELLLDIEKNFRKEFKNSPIWDQVVSQYGIEKAEELLKEIKISAERVS